MLQCLGAMAEQLDLPVTAKIRLLHPDATEKGDSSKVDIPATIQLCEDMINVGVQLLTIHGRNVFGKKQQTGVANWEAVREVVEAVGRRVPVVANGGIGSREDALRCLEYTGADAVMSSEALLEHPSMFERSHTAACGRSYQHHQLGITDEYLALVEVYGNGLSDSHSSMGWDPCRELSASAVSATKSHVFKFLYRMLQGEANWDLRARLGIAPNFQTIKTVVGQLRERAESVKYCDNEALSRDFLGTKSWYQRQR